MLMIKLGAKELRKSKPKPEALIKIKRNPIYIILDNVLDTYNVGAIFRLADAVAAEKIYLCGETATPEDPKVGHKIEKAAVSTWKWVRWQYAPTASDAIAELRKKKWEVRGGKWDTEVGSFDTLKKGNFSANSRNQKISLQKSKKSHFSLLTSLQIVAVEQDPRSIPYNKAKYEFPLAIVVGNETYGVSKEVLELADLIVEIPMWGVNKSLNVMVSCAIVLYKIMEEIKEA